MRHVNILGATCDMGSKVKCNIAISIVYMHHGDPPKGPKNLPELSKKVIVADHKKKPA